MTSTTFFFLFIPLLAIILLAVNLIFAPHNPYQEKNSAFECGFHSFLGQNRTQFSISFFIFALLFLLFDLEILLVYPYVVSAYTNGIYGLVIMLIFFLALTLGFAFELGKNALKIDSRQMSSLYNISTNTLFSLVSYFKPLNWIKTKINLILVNITLARFAGALVTIIFVALIRYMVSGNIHIDPTDFLNNIVLGSLTWIFNISSVSLLSDYLGVKNINFNLQQFLYGYDTMGAGDSSSLKEGKHKLYNAMGSNNSLPVDTEGNDSNLPRRRPVEPNHPHYDDIMMSSFHQHVLNDYIISGRLGWNSLEIRSALHFTGLKAGYLASGFDTNDLSVTNARRAHLLLAVHKLSLEGRGS